MPKKVKPIPEGFHALTPYLIIKGADNAIKFYEKALGAKERFRMTGPDGKSVMHAEIQIGDSILMLSEEMPKGNPSPASAKGTTVQIHHYVPDADASWKRALDAGCTVVMPIADTFWGDRYGIVEDPFGHRWGFATHKEDVPPEEMERRMKKMFCE